MKVLLLLPTAYAAISATQPKLFDAGHMKETFKAIASQKGDSNKLDNVTRTNIGTILNLIEGNLSDALIADYDSVVSDFEAAVAKLVACNTAVDACEAGPARTAFNRYENAVDSHRHCRQHEQSTCLWADSNKTIIDNRVRGFSDPTGFQAWTTGTVVDDDCYADDGHTVLDWMNAALGFLGTNGRGCDSPGTDGEACRVQGPDSHTDHNNVEYDFGCDHRKHGMGEDGSNGTFFQGCDYKTDRANFLIACKLTEDQSAQCNLFEEPNLVFFHCSWMNAGCTCCSTFDGCWSTETAALQAEDTKMRQMVDLIKTQQTALEVLICYGNEILADRPINFANCDDKTCEGGCAQFPYLSDDTQRRHVDRHECAHHFHQDTENPTGEILKPDLGGPYTNGVGSCAVTLHPSYCSSQTCYSD